MKDLSRNLGPTHATAAGRRVLVDVAAATGAPTLATDGVSTRGERFVNIIATASVNSWDATLYLYFENAGVWSQDLDYGTRTVTVAGGPDIKSIEIRGASRAYVRCTNFLAGGIANAWIEGVTV